MEPRRRPIPARTIVVEAAVGFLRSQQHALQRGLESAVDDDVVAEVAAGHDASHEAWTSTLLAVREHAPDDVVQLVVALFGFHSRVVRGLVDEESLRGSGPAETGVRRILADQVAQMTDDAVARLGALSDS